MSTAKTKNLTEGPIFSQLLLFGIPLMLTGMLQLLYNLADHVVVGKFSGDPYALAAVGTTAALTNITVNLLLGVSAGACVIVAQSFGADDKSRLERAVHTAISFSLLGGIVTGAIVFLIARPALTAMGTSSLFIDKSVLYMQIIALGIPASAVYNFGAGVLRSVGDSKTPLYILSATGILNVVLNMVFVILLHAGGRCDDTCALEGKMERPNQMIHRMQTIFISPVRRERVILFFPQSFFLKQ